jgi:hypothetical protein
MTELAGILKNSDYRRFMFISYGVVSCIFYILPLTGASIFFDEITISIYIQLSVSFILPLFISGYFLAPVFGPLATSKIMSFLMSFISLVVATFLFLTYQFVFENGGVSNVGLLEMKLLLFWVVVIVLPGLVPAFFASLFFAGQCENQG